MKVYLKTPQTMLDGLRGIKKWQRLNLQSVIEYNKKLTACRESYAASTS